MSNIDIHPASLVYTWKSSRAESTSDFVAKLQAILDESRSFTNTENFEYYKAMVTVLSVNGDHDNFASYMKGTTHYSFIRAMLVCTEHIANLINPNHYRVILPCELVGEFEHGSEVSIKLASPTSIPEFPDTKVKSIYTDSLDLKSVAFFNISVEQASNAFSVVGELPVEVIPHRNHVAFSLTVDDPKITMLKLLGIKPELIKLSVSKSAISDAIARSKLNIPLVDLVGDLEMFATL